MVLGNYTFFSHYMNLGVIGGTTDRNSIVSDRACRLLYYYDGTAYGSSTELVTFPINNSMSIGDVLSYEALLSNIKKENLATYQIFYGTNGSEPKVNDNRLYAFINQGISRSNILFNITKDENNAKNKVSYSQVITNTATSPITIREIGLARKFYMGSTYNNVLSLSGNYFLLTRDTCDITIEPGDSYTFTISMEI